MRQIVLDTETTGLDPAKGHRIIEIGCVELINRKLTGNHFHQYLQPDRDVDEGALEVHGISNEFLLDKPRFGSVADDFLTFVTGAELIIHNAPFDVGFIDAELKLVGKNNLESVSTVLDTLVMAREMYPGQRNSLDALCKRLAIDNSQRTLHGALLDAEILADVYLFMTGGQVSLLLPVDEKFTIEHLPNGGSYAEAKPTPVLPASDDELQAHKIWLEKLQKESDSGCVWDR
jgi:DNA polymerase-3 subunit epsilon